ncbi:putative shikimate kinase II [Pyrodictium delaneyi]|uniref:Shikimate kinase n=1 Tax=Pyrodictium delaneyi TaxID=1273541 RepID=A0A0P0N3M5_9CREN|nr:shikimate kinase [Pyrodictium delaneyi]ALL00998.1 putative shikimate kinase II [Pyrodictium delaneyi]
MKKRGRGKAHGALGIVNAIGSGGYGAAAALDLSVEVEVWLCSSSHGYTVTRGQHVDIDPAILDAVAETASNVLGRHVAPICARGFSEVPLEAGLKGSSALINALLEAVLGLYGVSLGVEELARLGVDAARRAGLTVTGALDDHLAVSGCGAYATDNTRQAIVTREPSLSGYAVIAVPGRRSIRGIDLETFRLYQELYIAAWKLVLAGDWYAAATVNGVATMMATGSEPSKLLALLTMEGVDAVGVSGKGPAVYAITSSRDVVPRVKDMLEKAMGAPTLVSRITPCNSHLH